MYAYVYVRHLYIGDHVRQAAFPSLQYQIFLSCKVEAYMMANSFYFEELSLRNVQVSLSEAHYASL